MFAVSLGKVCSETFHVHSSEGPEIFTWAVGHQDCCFLTALAVGLALLPDLLGSKIRLGLSSKDLSGTHIFNPYKSIPTINEEREEAERRTRVKSMNH